MPMPRPWKLPRSRQRKLALLIGAVAVPALILALNAIWLTLGVEHQIEAESARYNSYLAEKVIEAFERELVDQVRGALLEAEAIAKNGGSEEDIRRELAARAREFEAPQFVPLEALEGYSLVTVEGQLLIYGDDPSGRRDHPFAAMLLNGPDGTLSSTMSRRCSARNARGLNHQPPAPRALPSGPFRSMAANGWSRRPEGSSP